MADIGICLPRPHPCVTREALSASTNTKDSFERSEGRRIKRFVEFSSGDFLLSARRRAGRLQFAGSIHPFMGT